MVCFNETMNADGNHQAGFSICKTYLPLVYLRKSLTNQHIRFAYAAVAKEKILVVPVWGVGRRCLD